MSGLAAVVTYSVLTVLWGAIVALYLRHRRAARESDPLIGALLTVLALDAFKTLIESLYFGLYWGADYEVLPAVFTALRHPAWLTAVKMINVAVAVIVLAWLIRRWVPEELAERRAQREQVAASLRDAKESEQRFLLAAQASQHALWDWDVREDRVFYGDRFPEMLGVAPAEWPGTKQAWADRLHPDDRAAALAAIDKLLAGESATLDVVYRMRHADGHDVWVQSSAVLLRDEAGAPQRVVGFARDVTREREEEAHRAQAQKMESLGLLAGGISHDFNNLLTIISTSLDLARLDPKSAPDALATATTSVHRASALTRQLLAYAGRARREPEPCDVATIVGEIVELLGVSVSKKIALAIHAPADLPKVMADPVQLQQVIMNLVLNAADAIGDRDGKITIDAREVVMDEDEARARGVLGRPPVGRSIAIRVDDTGGGMSEEVQARIFDPFFTTKRTGHGLGLSTLLGILRAHDGAVHVSSRLGEGTTFTIYLPALGAAEAAAASAETAAISTSPLSAHVLVVDDEELVRKSASRLLARLGCRVITAGRGAEAIEAARAHPDLDVVLLDVTMPELDGHEVRARLRELRPDLAIVMSSGLTDAPSDEHLPSDVVFLSKPYDRPRLEAALREALSRRAVEREAQRATSASNTRTTT